MKKSNFPNNLKILRKQYSMTMEELGNHINVSKQTVSKYEKGLVDPNFHTLISISTVFDCSLDDLIFGNIERDFSNPNLFALKNLIDKDFSNFQKEFFNLQKEFSNHINLEINETKDQLLDSIENLYKSELSKRRD
ncbi:MAG: helix-turn-helix transcriptional regulator [Peptostreptococcaceae bacterium]